MILLHHIYLTAEITGCFKKYNLRLLNIIVFVCRSVIFVFSYQRLISPLNFLHLTLRTPKNLKTVQCFTEKAKMGEK